MTELRIRPATPADVERLCALAAATFREAYRTLCDPGEVEDYVRDAFTPASVAAWLREAGARTLLALRGEEAVGYARVRLGGAPACVEGAKPAELVRLYLRAALHGQGHGAAMMRACLETARGLGAQTLWLGVYEENRRAIRFYEAGGFAAVGTRPFEFGGRTYHDPVMARPLAAASPRLSLPPPPPSPAA